MTPSLSFYLSTCCFSACLSSYLLYLSYCLSVFLPVCSVCLSSCLSFLLSALPVFLPFCSTCLTACLSFFLSVCAVPQCEQHHNDVSSAPAGDGGIQVALQPDCPYCLVRPQLLLSVSSAECVCVCHGCLVVCVVLGVEGIRINVAWWKSLTNISWRLPAQLYL